MAFIGSLITTVKANTANFRKGLAKAAKATRKLRTQLKGLVSGAAKIGVALGAVAVGALLVYTIGAFKAIDATKKLADEIQIATSDLVSYQLAAGLEVVGRSVPDNMIEAIHLPNNKLMLGVQWHSEFLDTKGLDGFLFEALVKESA